MASSKDPFAFDIPGMGSLAKPSMAEKKMAVSTPPKPAQSPSQTSVQASAGARPASGIPTASTPGYSRSSSTTSLAASEDPFAALMGGNKGAQPMGGR